MIIIIMAGRRSVGRTIYEHRNNNDDINCHSHHLELPLPLPPPPHRKTSQPHGRRRGAAAAAAAAVLALFRAIANEPALMAAVVALNAIAVAGWTLLYARLVQHAAATATFLLVLPELRVAGYSAAELNAFYQRIGGETTPHDGGGDGIGGNGGIGGIQRYADLAAWELFPLLAAYPLLLGAILVRLARWKLDGYWTSDWIALAAVPVAVADGIATLLTRRGCLLYKAARQQRQFLSDGQILVASTAVTVKWALVALLLLVLAERVWRDQWHRHRKWRQRDRGPSGLPLWV